MSKEAQMVFECSFRLSVFVRLLKHLKTGDDASLHLIESDQPPELDVGSAFMARNDKGVWFKETQDFLLGGDLLAREHARARLSDHTPDQWENLLELLT